MQIGKYMKRDFYRVEPHTPLREVARLFFESGESVLPVTEADGTLAGLIMIDDFLIIFLPDYIDLIGSVDFLHNFGALEIDPLSIEEKLFVAEDLMRENIRVLEESDSILKAVAALHKAGLTRLPVVREGKLTGMVSENDICRAIYEMEGQQ